MASQLIRSELKEHTIGNFIMASELNVHLEEMVEPFDGQVSCKVIFPLNRKLKSSNRGSVDGFDVALIDSCILQTLPMTLISHLNIRVLFEMIAS